MLEQMLPSLITLSLLLCMFFWALLIDFLIHLQRRDWTRRKDSRTERRKNRLYGTLSESPSAHSRLGEESTFREI